MVAQTTCARASFDASRTSRWPSCKNAPSNFADRSFMKRLRYYKEVPAHLLDGNIVHFLICMQSIGTNEMYRGETDIGLFLGGQNVLDPLQPIERFPLPLANVLCNGSDLGFQTREYHFFEHLDPSRGAENFLAKSL